MLSMREQEDELFARWRLDRPGLITDGVVDEVAYLASSRRILFVLKEVNSAEAQAWDLRGFLYGGGHAASWDTITRWVEGIRALPADLTWPVVNQPKQTADQRASRRIAALRSIAVINLKKTPGSHTTDVKRLYTEAWQDQVFIRRQVQLYRPDLIICCGVGDLFRDLALFDNQPPKSQTSRGVSYYSLGSDRYVIDYLHPEARCASNLLYYGLIDALRELLCNEQAD